MTTTQTRVATLDLWMVAKQYLERSTAPGSLTYKAKRRDLILFIATVSELKGTNSVMVRDLTIANVTAFRDRELRRGAAASSVCRALATLKHFERKLAEHYGLRAELSAVKPPKVPARMPKELSRQQIAQCRAWLSKHSHSEFKRTRDTLVFELALATGIRAMEILQPAMEQVVWEESMIKNIKCKGSRYRDVYLPGYLNKHISPWMRERERKLQSLFKEHGQSWDAVPFEKKLKYPLFVSTKHVKPGRPETFRCTYGVIKNMFLEMSSDLGFRVHAHLCRHTRAHSMMRGTKDIRMVQKTLGHTDIKTTMIYADVAMHEVHAAQEEIQI